VSAEPATAPQPPASAAETRARDAGTQRHTPMGSRGDCYDDAVGVVLRHPQEGARQPPHVADPPRADLRGVRVHRRRSTTACAGTPRSACCHRSTTRTELSGSPGRALAGFAGSHTQIGRTSTTGIRKPNRVRRSGGTPAALAAEPGPRPIASSGLCAMREPFRAFSRREAAARQGRVALTELQAELRAGSARRRCRGCGTPRATRWRRRCRRARRARVPRPRRVGRFRRRRGC
jgi:hypothetical protein